PSENNRPRKSYRKFCIAILTLIVVTAALSIYFWLIRTPGSDNSAPPIHKQWKYYENQRLGFGLEYPDSWALEIQNADTITFSNLQGMGEITVSVANPESLELIRSSLNIDQESEISVNGIKGIRISEKNDAAGNALQIILITVKNKLFYIAGSPAQFDQIIKTFKFIN
ncbi:MAG: hypothetical protein AAB871_03330, partial [Patescibacteria group bacterium]